MSGIERIEKIGNEEIRAREGLANISKKIREARPRWLGHVERKTEGDVVTITWKMEVGGHRNIEKGLQREEAQERITWIMKTCCVDAK